MLSQHMFERPSLYQVLQVSDCFGTSSDTCGLSSRPVVFFFLIGWLIVCFDPSSEASYRI